MMMFSIENRILAISYYQSDTKHCNIYYMCDTRCTFVGIAFVTSSVWNDGKPCDVFVNKRQNSTVEYLKQIRSFHIVSSCTINN